MSPIGLCTPPTSSGTWTDGCVWWVETKKLPQMRVRTAQTRRLPPPTTTTLCSFFLSFRWGLERVFEEIAVLTSQEMKHRAPDRAVTKKSTVPWFLSTHTPTHAQTACKNSVWDISLGIGRALQELPPPCSSFSDHLHLAVDILLPPRFSGS